MNGNTRWIISLIGLFIMIATSLGAYSVARIDVMQDTLRTEYVQKVDYRCDVDDLKHALDALNKKMDRVLESRSNNGSK